MENKHVKGWQHVSWGKHKFKQQWDTTSYLLGWLTFKTPIAGKDVEQEELLLTFGGNVKWYSHFGS